MSVEKAMFLPETYHGELGSNSTCLVALPDIETKFPITALIGI
jgi:hypothetical protein